MRATLKLFFLSIFLVSTFPVSKPAMAESEDACAIWLCLPGGFPQGCSDAYAEFRHRIKKRRPPLPDLSSCTTGPNGERINGRYQFGYERYLPCEEGFILLENQEVSYQASCYKEECVSSIYRQNYDECENHEAKRRLEPSYVKMWVGGQYLGQFYY